MVMGAWITVSSPTLVTFSKSFTLLPKAMDLTGYSCWRNGGIGDKAAYWQDMGQGAHIFTAQNMGDMRGVQLGKSLYCPFLRHSANMTHSGLERRVSLL